MAEVELGAALEEEQRGLSPRPSEASLEEGGSMVSSFAAKARACWASPCLLASVGVGPDLWTYVGGGLTRLCPGACPWLAELFVSPLAGQGGIAEGGGGEGRGAPAGRGQRRRRPLRPRHRPLPRGAPPPRFFRSPASFSLTPARLTSLLHLARRMLRERCAHSRRRRCRCLLVEFMPGGPGGESALGAAARLVPRLPLVGGGAGAARGVPPRGHGRGARGGARRQGERMDPGTLRAGERGQRQRQALATRRVTLSLHLLPLRRVLCFAAWCFYPTRSHWLIRARDRVSALQLVRSPLRRGTGQWRTPPATTGRRSATGRGGTTSSER